MADPRRGFQLSKNPGHIYNYSMYNSHLEADAQRLFLGEDNQISIKVIKVQDQEAIGNILN